MQFIGLSDLVDLSLLLKDQGNNDDFNVGTPYFKTLREDLEALVIHAQSHSRIVGVPGWIARPLFALLGSLGKSPFVEFHYKTIDKDFYFDTGKLQRVFNWQPQKSNIQMLVEAYDWHVARLRKD